MSSQGVSPVSRPITALVCVLLKDSSRGPCGQIRTGDQLSSLPLCTTGTSPQCQMLILHPAFHLLSYVLPGDPKAGLRPNKPLTRTASCEPVSNFIPSADGVSILGETIHIIKKNTEVLVVCRKEICWEVNAKKTKYMFMCHQQHAGQNHNVEIDNNCFQRVEKFIFMGTTVTNQNCIHEQIKSNMKSGSGMLTIIWCSILCFWVCFQKI